MPRPRNNSKRCIYKILKKKLNLFDFYSFSGEFTHPKRNARVCGLSFWNCSKLRQLAKASDSACTGVLQHATAWEEWHCVKDTKYFRAKTREHGISILQQMSQLHVALPAGG
jgi:hypothetical protein